MNLNLSPDLEQWLREAVARGRFESLEEGVAQGLQMLQQADLLFEVPENLDELLAEGEADIEAGRVVEFEDAMAHLDRIIADARARQS